MPKRSIVNPVACCLFSGEVYSLSERKSHQFSRSTQPKNRTISALLEDSLQSLKDTKKEDDGLKPVAAKLAAGLSHFIHRLKDDGFHALVLFW